MLLGHEHLGHERNYGVGMDILLGHERNYGLGVVALGPLKI